MIGVWGGVGWVGWYIYIDLQMGWGGGTSGVGGGRGVYLKKKKKK